MRIPAYALLLLSVCKAGLYADLEDSESLIAKKEESYNSDEVVVAKSDIIRLIDTKFNTQNLKIANILSRKNEELVQKVSGLVAPVSQNIISLKDGVASIKGILADFMEKGKLPKLKAESDKLSARAIGNSDDQPSSASRSSSDEAMNNWNMAAEFLWWTAFQDASEFVLTRITIPTSQQGKDVESLGNYLSASFNWDPGFRLTAGYTFDRSMMDCWNVYVDYTYFRTVGSQGAIKPDSSTSFLFATFTDVSIGGLTAAHSKISLLYNFGEIWLQRRFQPTKRVGFDFATGLAGAWLNENWRVYYEGIQKTDFINKWSYHAGGMTTKVKSRWNLGESIEIYNEFQGGLFIGSYLNRNKINFPPPISSFVQTDLMNPVRDTNQQLYPIVPMLRASLGLQWNYVFDWGVMRLGTDAEATTWFGLHTVHYTTQGPTIIADDKKSTRSSSNVTLYGVSFKTGFDF